MGLEVTGLFGLLVLVLDIYAVLKIVGSTAPTPTKVLWVLIILVLPVLGFIIWLLLGPSRPADLRNA